MTVEKTELHHSTLCDAPAKLREMANDIEAGKYGEIATAVVVLYSDQLRTFGYGPFGDAPNAAIALAAAHADLVEYVRTRGRKG